MPATILSADKARLLNQLLTTALEGSPDGTLIVDESGRVVTWNRRFLDLWRIAPELVKAGDDWSVLSTGAALVVDRASFIARVRYLYEHPEVVAHDEIEFLDGRFFDRHSSVLRGNDGAYLGRIWFFRDITEHKKFETALTQREARLQSIFNSVDAGIIVADIASGAITDVNAKVTELLQYTRAELVAGGLTLLSGEGPYDIAQATRRLASARDGEPQAFEWQIRRKDGRVLWFDISMRRTVVNDRDVVLLTAHDITERKRIAFELIYRDRLLHAITTATQCLVEHRAFEGGMAESLKVVGEALDADQIVVTQFGLEDAAPIFRFVWQPSSRVTRTAADLARMPLDAGAFKDWRSRLRREKYVASYATGASPGEAPLFAYFQLEAILMVPIFTGGNYWGGLAVGSRTVGRAWSTVEIDLATTFAGVLGAMTERNASQAELQKSEAHFRAVSDAAQDAIIMIDAGGAVRYWNLAAARILGYEPAEIAGRNVVDTIVPRSDRAAVRAMLVGLVSGESSTTGHTQELVAIRRDGTEIPVEASVAPLIVGDERFLVAIVRDISERKRSEQKILQMARTDALTGLANRAVFVEALDRAITAAHRGPGFAVLYLDLDHFKDVNDTLGHPVGDELLRTIGARLTDSIRDGDTVARFGGDEFALLEAGIGEPVDAGVLAEKILRALAVPVEIAGNVVQVGCSVGIAIYGPDALTAESLLGHADVALYRAKAEGRGTYRFFTERMNDEVHERFNLAADLRRALLTDELFLAYQPQIEIDSGNLVGLEALVRWRHPVKGLIAPSTLVDVAEKSGLIVDVGRWVFERTCRQIRAWTDAGIAVPVVGVNFSALQFRMPAELEVSLSDALAKTGVSAQALELELTETALMETSREHSDVFQRLRKTGFSLAIDDFGTGYSSLVYLREFPVDRIKIAQNFVRSLLTNAGDAVIVRATIAMAQALGIKVVAEGVETLDELTTLRSWGCRIAQGFYFSEPLSPDAALPILRTGTMGARPA